MTLVQVSCFPTAATSLSNFPISVLIVPMYGVSSSSLNLSIVVRVRFPRRFHWIPETVSLLGAFLYRRILLIVSRIWSRSASSFTVSLDRWTTIVLSIFLAGPEMVSCFFSFPFLATLAQVFVGSVVGAGVWFGGDWWDVGGGWVWLFPLRFGMGWVFAPEAGSVGGVCLPGSRCCLPMHWICCSRRVWPCLRSLFWFFKVLMFPARVVTSSLSSLSSEVRISTVLRIALFVAIVAWEAICCWRMDCPSPNPKTGLERWARRRRGVSMVASSNSLSSAAEEALELGSDTSRSVSPSGFSEV